MPGFFDKIKSGAESARFEAEKALRLQQAQSALSKLERDLEMQQAAIGKEVVALYDAGALSQPELATLCQQLDSLRQQITQQQAQVEHIRLEKAPVEGATAPAPAPAAGRVCPNCGTAVAADTRFCPGCGNNLQAAPPPARPAGNSCPACGSSIPANVAFCPECGARIPA
jgi:hypothetical protein